MYEFEEKIKSNEKWTHKTKEKAVTGTEDEMSSTGSYTIQGT